ncbi:MAG: 2-C-methyl-D-erythritol 4-phosphate cytidylyltransferase [Pirellulales bacterium]|nr:2-C-methyl-D-erythritol 4-phosphate cytidylyltransferase [Pirellulales bacterium]
MAHTFAVIIAAAGKSTRFRDQHYKKPFAPLANKPVWLHSAERFINRADVKQVILVISPADAEVFAAKFAGNAAILGIEIVHGGQERADSIEKALARVRPDIGYVAVHDAARPCLADAWITQVFDAAAQSGAAILAIPVRGTLKKADNQGKIIDTIPRDNLWEAQTPQVFRRDWLLAAYAQRNGFNATDDAQLLERSGKSVTLVSGSAINLKITTREDLKLAEHALQALPRPKLGNAMNPFADDDMWR